VGVTDVSVFERNLRAWQEWQEAPWGRLRYAVVGHVLNRVAGTLGERLRVLDVGGGDGGDAVPLALAGHEVTVIDPSSALLDLMAQRAAAARVEVRGVCGGVDVLPALMASAGEADLVLCHNVLQYLEDVPGAVSTLVSAVRPGGALSLIGPNPAGEVLVSVVRGLDPAGALARLDAGTVRSVTFDHDVALVDPDDLSRLIVDAGCEEPDRFGVRCVTDLVTDEDRKHEATFYTDLERLEIALCDREPFVRTARMWQLVSRRSG
jgi:S-adenosylmethionine-dependent methyltransferase